MSRLDASGSFVPFTKAASNTSTYLDRDRVDEINAWNGKDFAYWRTTISNFPPATLAAAAFDV